MKICKVTITSEIVNYIPKEDSRYIKPKVNTLYYSYNIEKLFKFKSTAEKFIEEETEKLKNDSFGIMNDNNNLYYVKNVWEDNQNPYTIFTKVILSQVDVEE